MKPHRLLAGEPLPHVAVPTLNSDVLTLGKPIMAKWQLIVVYRGMHSESCDQYLTQLEHKHSAFEAFDVEVLIVSADPLSHAQQHIHENLKLSLMTGYDLSIDQMNTLGLYISNPSTLDKTDRPFAEPGLLLVNDKHQLHLIDISNNPYTRPDLDCLYTAIKEIKHSKAENTIRGTHTI